MSLEILLVDAKPDRGKWIQTLFQKKGVDLRLARNLYDAVLAVESNSTYFIVVAHCDFLNDSFTNLARLRKNPNVKILFYATDDREKLRSAPLIPDEIDALVQRIDVVAREQSALPG